MQCLLKSAILCALTSMHVRCSLSSMFLLLMVCQGHWCVQLASAGKCAAELASRATRSERSPAAWW